MAQPVAGQHRAGAVVAGMKMHNIHPWVRAGICSHFFGASGKKTGLMRFFSGISKSCGEVSPVWPFLRKVWPPGRHVRAVKSIFIEADKIQPAQILRVLRPKEVSPKRPETDQAVILYLLQAGHVAVRNDEGPRRKAVRHPVRQCSRKTLPRRKAEAPQAFGGSEFSSHVILPDPLFS